MNIPAFCLASVAALMLGASAQAASLSPGEGYVHSFEDGASILVYYTAEPDGWRVVTTTQTADDEQPAVQRFVTTLGAGQMAFVSVPGAAGRSARAVKMLRDGDRLTVSSN